VTAWALYLLLLGPSGERGDLAPPDMTSGLAGLRASYDWTLEDLDGRKVELSEYRGKPLFLNIWATWCPPCVEEMPSIASLAANPRLKGMAFVCASTDDDPETVRAFLRARRLKIPALWADGPPPRVFRREGIPATFVISADGKVVLEQVGSARWDDPEVVDRLESLVKSSRRGD
jgi:thiol-disulfide isomerase/thioredoxin